MPVDDFTPINKKRGRKKKITTETQHPVYIAPDVWEAAGDLPVSRPDIIRQALLDAIAYYKDDLPKLKWQLEELRSQIMTLQSKESVIISRIAQLEAKAVIEVDETKQAESRKEIAVTETLTMCRAFKKNMGYSHYIKLEELSGIDAARIEAFLKDAKFRPKEETVRVFYTG